MSEYLYRIELDADVPIVGCLDWYIGCLISFFVSKLCPILSIWCPKST